MSAEKRSRYRLRRGSLKAQANVPIMDARADRSHQTVAQEQQLQWTGSASGKLNGLIAHLRGS